MHGLFATAADYLMTGATNGLRNNLTTFPNEILMTLLIPPPPPAFVLANLGFDIWLGNSRGSDYGLNHRTLDSHSKQFWNFSFHEIGNLDLPAMLDFVLNATGAEKVFYVAHSQGCTALMVLLATRPEYNDKIHEAHLMAPAVFMANFPHPFVRFFASEFDAFVERTKSYDLISNSQIMSAVEPMNAFFCQPNSPTVGMCTNLIQMVCGKNENGTETDVKVMPVLVKFLAHAVSTKQIHHFVQLYQSGRFQQYSYGAKNRAVYGQMNPPEYELKRVNIPVCIYAGKNDMMVAEKVGVESFERDFWVIFIEFYYF
jgi:lysosomal acid lipase/cholesteryl ester hydrolase